MPDLILYIIAASTVSVGIGIFIGRIMLQKVLSKYETEAEEKAKLILKEAELKAETTKRDKQLEAKEHFLKLKTEFEEESNKKKNLIIQNANKVFPSNWKPIKGEKLNWILCVKTFLLNWIF